MQASLASSPQRPPCLCLPCAWLNGKLCKALPWPHALPALCFTLCFSLFPSPISRTRPDVKERSVVAVSWGWDVTLGHLPC